MQDGSETKPPESAIQEAEIRTEPEIEPKRTRNLGALRVALSPYPDVFLVLADVPAFNTVDEWEKWVRTNGKDGVRYAWIRTGESVMYVNERRRT